jgi:hypothetical protein
MTDGVEMLTGAANVEAPTARRPPGTERSVRDAVHDLELPWLLALLPVGSLLTAGVLLVALAVYTR